MLKSWPLAITAYNHGVGGMKRAVRKTGTTNIGVINREYKGRTFGFASRNFYVAFLAAYDVQRNAKQYFGEIDLNPPRKDIVIKLPRYVPARAIATAAGVSYSALKEANPGLLQPVWDGTKHVPRDFAVRIPESLTNRSAKEIIAAIPAAQRFAAQTPDQYHKVKRGESLSVIASRYDASVSELVALNKLKSRHQIRIGQVLRLPYAGLSIPEGARTYKVQSGDSLSTIASRAGVSQSRLMQLNNLPNKNRIYAGQVLYLAPPDDPVRDTSNAQPAPAATPQPAPAVAARPAVTHTGARKDPNDYSVATDGTVEIYDGETLGHFADWLGVKTQRLRDLNGLPYGEPVPVGRRIKLDFANQTPAQFAAQRADWHRALQADFFSNYRVTSTTEHKVQRGESLWVLTYKRYKVPVWLLRQYNPDLNFGSVQAGTRVVFPRIERVDQEA